METSSEIRGILKNIRYYSEQINELSKKQFGRDFEIGQVTGMNPEPGSVRFDCIGAIGVGARWIETYCDNIEANVKCAEELDRKLRPLPEELEKGVK